MRLPDMMLRLRPLKGEMAATLQRAGLGKASCLCLQARLSCRVIMPVISAANLSIGYKGSPIVSNINLRLSTGRIICLLGANGAGKTTLMKTLLGRIKPVSGEVTYTGTNINEMSAAIDHPSFFPYLSGRENVEVVSAFWGLDVDPEAALDGVGINRAAYGRRRTTRRA